MDQRQIGWRKRVGANLSRSNPPIGCTPEGLRFAVQDGATIKTETDMALRVIVLRGEHLFVNCDGQPQLFLDLSFQAGLEALAGLPFAAGKLPESAQMGIIQTLGDEDLPTPDDEAGCYLDDWRVFWDAVWSLSHGYERQNGCIGQIRQSGLRAVQMSAPKSIRA